MSFRVMTRTSWIHYSSWQKKILRKVSNEVSYNFEKIVTRGITEKYTKDSDFIPSEGNSESLMNTPIDVDDSIIRKFRVDLKKITWRVVYLMTRCKETFANDQTRKRKDKITVSLKDKDKGKDNDLRKYPEEKDSTITIRLDLRMKMDSERWMILIWNVVEFIDEIFSFKSTRVLWWIRRHYRVRRREFYWGVRSQRLLMNSLKFHRFDWKVESVTLSKVVIRYWNL